MSDSFSTSPIFQLFKLSGYTFLTTPTSLQYFTDIQRALEQDGQSGEINHVHDVEVDFQRNFSNTTQLFNNEHFFLQGLIQSWSSSVISPFIATLNLIAQGDHLACLRLSFDSTCSNEYLAIDGIDNFSRLLQSNTTTLEEVESLLAEYLSWSNSLLFVRNSDALLESIHVAIAWHTQDNQE